MQALREEVNSLNDLVREKDNYISRKEMGGEWRAAPRAQEGAGISHMVEKLRELER